MKGLAIPEFAEMMMRRRKSLVADPASCTGCRSCETACSLSKTGRVAPYEARLRIERTPFEGRFTPHVCRQCPTPDCLKACPDGAVGISETNGTVLVDPKKCNGCGACVDACPYGMIQLDPLGKKAVKCNLCGGRPLCVRVCPAHALGLADYGGPEAS